MRPNIHNAERRAALRRLRRAQLAEARRIRRGLPHPPGRRRRLHPDTGAPVRPLPRPPARRGPPGGDVPDARADALAARATRSFRPGGPATGTTRRSCTVSP